MIIRWVLEELAQIKGYKCIRSMINVNDYNMIMAFTKHKAMLKDKTCIHLSMIKKIARLFDVPPKFVLSIVDYERIQDGRVI